MDNYTRIYKTLIITVLLSFVYLAANSQKQSRNEFLGDLNYKTFSYNRAINFYEDAYNKDTLNMHIIKRLIVCNYNLRKFTMADEWASKAIAIDSSSHTAEEIAYYIEILAANRKYDEAVFWFDLYLNMDSTDQQQIDRISAFLNVSSFEDKSSDYQVYKVSFNSDFSDFGLVSFNDTLVFTSGRGYGKGVKKLFKNNGIEYLNLYKVFKNDDGSYSDPKNFSWKVKSSYNEGPITFYDNNTKVIFSQNKNKARHWYGNRMDNDEDGTNNVQLYMADYNNGNITKIKEFPWNNKDFTNAHATVSEDGKLLVYASNMPGGEGGSDLYICTKSGNTWSSPRNLGINVNTEGNELFPFLYGNILYFSSDGHKGIGSLDIYKTMLINKKAQKSINLGYPLNSSYDDFTFQSMNGKSGYFASNRGDEESDNIYYFYYDHNIPPAVSILALDTVTNEFIENPDIYLVIKDSVMPGLIPINVVGDTIFTFVVDTTMDYDVIGQKTGYLVHEEYYNFADTNVWIIPMTRIDVGVTITLKNIYYDFDKATLRDSSRFELNKLIGWLEDNPQVHIKLKSHTDSRGNDKYNLKLSDRRAKSVVDYLVESGIDSVRLESQGMGETEPIYSCPNPHNCTKEQHQANRRTEFEVMSVIGDSTQIEQNDSIQQNPYDKSGKTDDSEKLQEELLEDNKAGTTENNTETPEEKKATEPEGELKPE